jgi:hypothetical protein
MARWVFMLGIGLVVVAVAFVVTDELLSAQPGVTERNVRRIRPGMTLEEVEALLGRQGFEVWDSEPPDTITRCWKNEEFSVIFDFDAAGRMQRVFSFYRWEQSKDSSLWRLRPWLGW